LSVLYDIKMPKDTRVLVFNLFWTDIALTYIHWYLNNYEPRLAVFVK